MQLPTSKVFTADSPARQALNALPINTHGPPRGFFSSNTTLKRHIEDVDSCQSPPPSVRFRPTTHTTHARTSDESSNVATQKTAQHDHPRGRDSQAARRPVHVQDLSAQLVETTAANMSHDLEEGDSQGTCKDSETSLVDYDPMDDTMASQQTVATEISNTDRSAVSMRAEILRLRLRVAMFKVRTNQTCIPMSQLRIPPKSPPVPHSTLDSSPEQNASVPKLLPAPNLKPTAYSARTILQPRVPSSPPTSYKSSPEGDAEKDVFRTPALPKGKIRAMDLQLSSPPGSQERDMRVVNEAESLTSSAVRGSAARSLLGLAQKDR